MAKSHFHDYKKDASACTIRYMKLEETTVIAASAAAVWAVYEDVEAWPEWTGAIVAAKALDANSLAIGHRFRLEQPRIGELMWEITELEPGVSWKWLHHSPGGSTEAWHELTESDEGTVTRAGVTHHGLFGNMSGLILARATRRFLRMEVDNLKIRVEGGARDEPNP